MATVAAEMTIGPRTVLESEESLAAAVHRTLDSHRVTQVFERATGERLAWVWENDYEYTVAGQQRLLTDARMGRWPRY
ncbi:MAG TPA: hypothetical protein VFI79_11615 [Gemmatimonadales bacterium]|nr:hypothetical protein [Gemmatimonadales bacterium]